MKRAPEGGVGTPSVAFVFWGTTLSKPTVLLKNGHPAHVYTMEDRRKAADVTNQIRREKCALFEQLRLNQKLGEMLARDAARRQRRAAKQRRRREELTEQQRIDTWVERGYGRRL